MKLSPFLLRKVNILLGLITFFLLITLAAIYFFTSTKSDIAIEELPIKAPKTLTFSFLQEPTAYNAIKEPLLTLEKRQIKAQLPDLRSVLVSFGINCRPDSLKEDTFLQLGIRGQQIPYSTKIKEKVYLRYDGKTGHNRWSFSENNSPTAVWIEPTINDKSIVVQVFMQDADGNLVQDTNNISYFVLPDVALPPNNPSITGWNVGPHQVDPSLFAKQKAKWYGKDLFLQKYGGDEYSFALDRERIEFDNFAIYAKEGDVFIWENNSWQAKDPGPETVGKTLLHAKRVQEQNMSFDLWDPTGKHKIALELHKIHDVKVGMHPVDIKLVGARSRKDWIAEVGSERILLKSDDWLIAQSGEIERITSNDQIDDFLAGALKGELIVLEGSKKIDNTMCLVGVRFNETRTQAEDVYIPFATNTGKGAITPQGADESQGRREQNAGTAEGKDADKSPRIAATGEEDEDIDEDEDDDEDDYI